jgi:hypothetical protein
MCLIRREMHINTWSDRGCPIRLRHQELRRGRDDRSQPVYLFVASTALIFAAGPSVTMNVMLASILYGSMRQSSRSFVGRCLSYLRLQYSRRRVARDRSRCDSARHHRFQRQHDESDAIARVLHDPDMPGGVL